MTMFSAEDPRQFHGGYGYTSYDQTCIGSDLVIRRGPLMAEDGSGTGSLNGVAESTREERDEGWLQLSIGGGSGGGRHSHVGIIPDRVGEENLRRDGPGLVELDLLPGSRAQTQICGPLGPILEFRPPRPVTSFPTIGTGFSPSFFLQHPGNSSTSDFQQQQDISWAFRPVVPINIITTASSSSPTSFSYPSTLLASGSYFSRPPFQIYPGVDLGPAPVPRPGLDFRVIPPPRRPHSGIWFMLQASKNPERELSLPQISKSYLRIKDGRMTIRLVMKYLVNKLSLENESEIEITCKGQRLQPFLTLQHVRDNIWSSTNRNNTYVNLLPNSSTVDHIMVLYYARSTASSN